MIKRILFLSLLILLSVLSSSGKTSHSPEVVIPYTGGFVVKHTLSADTVYKDLYSVQDTLGAKRRIKQIAPAKRQPKPERIDDPANTGNTPGGQGMPLNRPGRYPGVIRNPDPFPNGGESIRRPDGGADNPQQRGNQNGGAPGGRGH